jgi:hypothetical protein
VVRPHLEVRLAQVVRLSLYLGFYVSLLWCVFLIQHDHDEFGLLGVDAQDFTQCEHA